MEENFLAIMKISVHRDVLDASATRNLPVVGLVGGLLNYETTHAIIS